MLKYILFGWATSFKINQNYDTDIVMYTYLFFEVCFVSLIKLPDAYLILWNNESILCHLTPLTPIQIAQF